MSQCFRKLNPCNDGCEAFCADLPLALPEVATKKTTDCLIIWHKNEKVRIQKEKLKLKKEKKS